MALGVGRWALEARSGVAASLPSGPTASSGRQGEASARRRDAKTGDRMSPIQSPGRRHPESGGFRSSTQVARERRRDHVSVCLPICDARLGKKSER